MTRASWLLVVPLLSSILIAAGATTSIAAPEAATWSVQHTPWYTHRHGDLVDVSCPGRGFCMAIGDRGDGHEFAVARVRGKWRLVAVPGTVLDLRAIACESARFCMAVGSALNSSAGKAVVLQWNGSRWRTAPTPRATDGVDIELDDVACTSASRCAVVGDAGDDGYGFNLGAFAAEWTGTGWRTTYVSAPARELQLAGVSCSSARFCVAVGVDSRSSAVLRWNGHAWRDVPAVEVASTSPRAGATLSDVSCRARGECLAIGQRYRNLSDYSLMTVRRHEGRWTLSGRRLPKLQAPVISLSCSTTGRCIGLAGAGTSHTEDVVVRTGGAWMVRPLHDASGDPIGAELPALACSVRSCTLVGWVGSRHATHTRIFRYAAGVAHRVTSPTPLSNDETVLHDVACPTTRMCLAVGPGAGLRPIVERYENGKWHLPSRTVDKFSPSAVSCSSARFCVATGSNGSRARFARWSRSHWRVGEVPMLGPGTTGFNSTADDVSCPSDQFCAAVGQRYRDTTSYATAAVWRATVGWRQLPVPVSTSVAADSQLDAVSCTSAVSCVAVGRAAGDALVERWNGTAWSLVDQRSGAWDFISCSSKSFCMLIGGTFPHGDPVTARWDGASLHTLRHPVWGPVSCVSSTDCTVSVHDGSFRRWTGRRWVFERGVRLHDAFFSSISCVRRTCTAVGQRTGPVDLPLAARIG